MLSEQDIKGMIRKRTKKELARLRDDDSPTPKAVEGQIMHSRKFYERGFNGSRWIREMISFFEPLRLVIQELKERLKILGRRTILKSRAEYNEIIQKLTLVDFFLGFAGGVAVLSALLVFLSGFYLLGYQAVLWLKDGIWTEFPLLVAFDFVFQGTAFQVWLSDPGSWFGLHTIAVWALETLPLSLILIMDGAFLMLVLIAVMSAVAFFRYYQIKKL